MSKGIDTKQCVHNISKHADSPTAYLTFKMIQYSVCLINFPLESLSKSKISNPLVFSQI
jgi:hypothetical protein